MVRSEARVATSKPMGLCRLDATAHDSLHLKLSAEDADQLARLEQVVGSHLERFGRRDELAVSFDN
jgi:hypothetical protein